MNPAYRWLALLAPSLTIALTLSIDIVDKPLPLPPQAAAWLQTPPQAYNLLTPLLLQATARLLNDGLLALKAWALLLTATLPLTIYPLARHASKNRFTATLTVWLLALTPALYNPLQHGNFALLLALTLLPIATYLFIQTVEHGTLKNYVLAIVFGLAVTISEFLAATILVATSFAVLAVHTRTPGMSPKGVLTSLPLLAIITPVYALQFAYLRPPAFLTTPALTQTYRDGWAVLAPTALPEALIWGLAALGFYALYKHQAHNEATYSLLTIVLPLSLYSLQALASAGGANPLVYTVAGLTFLVAASTRYALDHLTTKITKSSNQSPDEPIEIEVRWDGLAVLVLLSLAALTSLPSAIASTQWPEAGGPENHARYQALAWIRQNPPQGNIATDDAPLGAWLEGLTRRQTLRPPSPGEVINTMDLDRLQAAHTLLDTNVELRNPWIRLLDTSPYDTTHTPWLTAYNGTGYTYLVYLVDAAMQIAFQSDTAVWIEAPYNALRFNMSWTERSAQRLTFQMRFETISLFINKTLTLDSSRPEAEIRYDILPKPGFQLLNASLAIWIPWESAIKQFFVTANTFRLELSTGVVEGRSTGGPVALGQDPVGKQRRLLLPFTPENNTLSATVTLTAPDATADPLAPGLWGGTFEELLARYDVEYIIVSKQNPSHSRLLADPRVRTVFENPLLTIFTLTTKAK